MRSAAFAVGGARWWLGEGVEEGAAQRNIERAFAALSEGDAVNIKSGRRKALYPLHLNGGAEADYLLKVNHYGPGRWWRPSKARRELERAEAVAARGIPTPVPLAAGELRRGPRLEACYLLVGVLPGVVDLRQLVLDPEGRARPLALAERRALARGFGIFTRRVLEAGIFQEDFAPNNFLVRRGEEPEFLMIDFERAALQHRLGERSWRFVLTKLERELAQLSSAERMRFLIAFSEGDRVVARRWWRSVAQAAPRLARRDLARSLRNSTREGRRFQELQIGEWRGFARRSCGDARLQAALAEDFGVATRSVQAIGETWCVRYPRLSPREGQRLWSLANFLYAHRRLSPDPLALLHREDGQSVLLLARQASARRLVDLSDRQAAEVPLRLLTRRLLALGEFREPPGPDAVALQEGPGKRLSAQLLAPEALMLRGRSRPDASERARDLAQRLVGRA